jgi:hypothetical protein
MEWWEALVFGVCGGWFGSLLILHISGVFGKDTRDDVYHDVWERSVRSDIGYLYRTVADRAKRDEVKKAVESHVQEFHIPQQQLMERQARAEEVRAAMKAEVV